MNLLTWDGNSINDGSNYEAILNADAYGLAAVFANLGKRQGKWPLVGSIDRPGKAFHIDIYIRNASPTAYQKQLMQWFDPEDETPKKLIGEDSGGGNDRYVYAICESLDEVPFSAGLHYVVSLQIDGDVRWRETAASTQAWSVTGTGDTEAVTNSGEDDAYLILEIQPTSSKTGSYDYKRWIPVRWRADDGATKYHMDICNNAFDTDALTTAKMLANGDDLRVLVNGSEVDRWLDGMDTETTSVWINLNFDAKQDGTLDGAIGDSDVTITINEDISGFPVEGILVVESETITYTGRNITNKEFTGCTRGAKGSTAAGHADDTAIWWCQHDVWILYGDSGASAPVVDDDYEAAFELATSTNIFWDYDEFGENNKLRAAQWMRNYKAGTPIFYGGNQSAAASPWVELGLWTNNPDDHGQIYLSNPCGITNVNFENGEGYAEDIEFWTGQLVSSNGIEFDFTGPTTDATWQAVANKDQALSPTVKIVGLSLKAEFFHTITKFEFSDCEITLDSNVTPVTTIGAEQANYQLDCTITNNTTGEAIKLAFTMEEDEELQVNTDTKKIVYLLDDSNQFQALTVVGGPRRDWLALQPGSNTLQFDDVGTGNVTIALEWSMRYFH